MDELKKENKIVAGWLLYYPERKKEYYLRRVEALHSSGPSISDPELVPGGRNIIGDPTGRKGGKLADLEQTEKWLLLVEEVESRLPDTMLLFLRIWRRYRYCKGTKVRSWVRATQFAYAEAAAKLKGKSEDDVWIDRSTVYQWRDRIIDYAARMASKMGLLPISEENENV